VGELASALERREEIVAVVRDAGYRYVTLDLEGFRSGNLNGDLS
jgi:PP-loop superfamily ATP-utilizing enzyme